MVGPALCREDAFAIVSSINHNFVMEEELASSGIRMYLVMCSSYGFQLVILIMFFLLISYCRFYLFESDL